MAIPQLSLETGLPLAETRDEFPETPMPAVILRRIDPTKNMARFYAIDIQPTLFGDWAVIRRVRAEAYQTWAAATAVA